MTLEELQANITTLGTSPERGAGQTRVQQVMQAVGNYIRDGRLKPGDQLPSESEFAQELGVGRSVMREAFRALSALNVIDVQNGRRARVAVISTSPLSVSLDHAIGTNQITLQQVWQVRHILEPKAAALAATNRTTEEADLILHHAHMMTKSEPGSRQLMHHDVQLHEAVARATRNILMAQVLCSVTPLILQVATSGWRSTRTPQAIAAMMRHHQLVAEAIAASDPKAAERAMDHHFDPALSLLFNSGSEVAKAVAGDR